MARLAQAAEPLHLTVAACPDPSVAAASIRGLVAERSPEWGGRKQVVAWDHPLVHALDLPGALSGQNVPVAFVEPLGAAPGAERLAGIRKQVVDSFVGVTSADFCLADTATLVMKTRPGQPRSVSLVPSIHVAVIEAKQLLWDLGELYRKTGHRSGPPFGRPHQLHDLHLRAQQDRRHRNDPGPRRPRPPGAVSLCDYVIGCPGRTC